MKLHTTLTRDQMFDALFAAQNNGKVAEHVYYTVLEARGSRKRDHAFELRLGTDTKVKGDGRYHQNTGIHGSDTTSGIYTATWDEWGWVLALIFAADPEATCDRYDGEKGFHEATGHKYHLAPV